MLRAVAQQRTLVGGAAGADPNVEPVAPGVCPHIVPRPFMDQDWLGLSFLHWRYRSEDVQRLLPGGLSVETCEGTAWVGLVPFLLRVRIPGGPVLPWVGVFPETNVRTYVRGPDGHSGIWFFSLEAPRRLAVRVARGSFHLPYHLAAMQMERGASTRTYASWRLAAHHRGASSRARVTLGTAIPSQSVTALEHFLTARWRLYAPFRGGIGTALVEHAPWRLWRSTAQDVDACVLVAAGLPRPVGDPLVHACDDVHASLTRLRRCAPPVERNEVRCA